MLGWVLSNAQGANFAATDAPLGQLLAASGFAALPSVEQHLVIGTAADVSYRVKDFERALKLATQATSMSEATPDDWGLRVRSGLAAGNLDDVLTSMQLICTRWGSAFSQVSNEILAIVARTNQPQYREARGALLQALFERRWQPDISSTHGEIWLQYALQLIERGDKEDAREAAAHITDPYSIIGLEADDRFKKVRWGEYVPTHVHRAAMALLESRQKERQQRPRSLQYLIALGRVQLQQAHTTEALALTESALGQIAVAPATAAPFDDQVREYQTLMALHAEAVYQAGRFSEALAQLQSAVDLPATYAHSTTIRIRLAEWMCRLDQASAAAALLPALDAGNIETAMWEAAIRADVALEANDQEAWNAAVSELRAHELQAPARLQSALLHKGDLDGAAQVLIRRLESPEQRLAALIAIQTYQNSPEPPRVQTWLAQEHQLMQRADVRAAISKVGSIDKYELLQ
jgi:hypothetical protein